MTFRATAFENFDGWLVAPAAHFTEWLITNKPELKQGPVYEIGVWYGKFLSVLYQCTEGPVVGFDLFEKDQSNVIRDSFATYLGDNSRLMLRKGDSAELSSEDIAAALGSMSDKYMHGRSASIISIDGSHQYDGVMHDLYLAKDTLNEDGFVAYDDFLNPNCLGVNNAFYDFRSKEPESLVPFAYVTNKLFMCRPSHHASYLTLGKEFQSKFIDEPWMQHIKKQKDSNMRLTVKLTGYEAVRVHA